MKLHFTIFLFAIFTLVSTGQVTGDSVQINPLDSTLGAEIKLKEKPAFNLNIPKVYTIKSIEIEGTNRNKSAVLLRSGLAEGDQIKIPSDVTSDAIKKLWDSKLFTDVKLYISKIEGDNIHLLFKFRESPQIGKIVVVKAETGKNPSKSEREDLAGDLKNLTYRSYGPNVIFRAEEIIKNFYI